jgi:transposase-like protein
MSEPKPLAGANKRRGRTRGVPWPEEDKANAMAVAARFGVAHAVRELGVPEPTLRNWLANMGKPRAERTRPVQRDNRVRQAAVRLAKKIGIRRAAGKLGIPVPTVNRWVKEPNKLRTLATYTDDYREEAIALAKHIGGKPAAAQLGIPAATLYSWVYKSRPIGERASRPARRVYTAEEIAEAVSIATRVGTINAADQLGIPEGTVRNWVQAASGKVSVDRKYTPYSAEDKERVLEVVQQRGVTAASQEFDIDAHVIRRWAKNAGVKSPRKVGHHAAWDISFAWLVNHNVQMEEWRALAHEWMGRQTEAIESRMTALSLFFKAYILKQGITTFPDELLSRVHPLPPHSVAFPDTRHGKVCLNYTREFLDWVLLSRFGEVDARGQVFVDPLFRNPLPKASFAGDSSPSESVFSPLPYEFLVEARRIIVQGSHFRDWTWAQSQLGVGAGKQGGVAPEWFEVPRALIDEDDPDCVWRRRARAKSAGGPRYEIWSPVRWVAQLVKIIIPPRTLQIRLLDSGEADTKRYDIVQGVGTWSPNRGPLRSGSEAKPLRQGVFRQPANELLNRDVTLPPGWANAVLYVNTNKTADSKRSGHNKGYVLPWVSEGGLENDVFFWLHKIRVWQEKYNPIQRRTSWKELDGRHIVRKSEVQLAGFPDTCFLFRLPEARDNQSHFPIAEGMLNHTWYAVLEELESRLRLNGKVNLDGSAIKLVNPERKKKITYFPPHSVRVSIVTALAEAGLPLTYIMQLCGHSRLAMTIYYRKQGQVEAVAQLAAAFEKLRAAGDALLTDWLRNTEHAKLLEAVITNNDGALLGAIPKHPASRNPLGWMPVGPGMCLVGGNVSALEEAGNVQGGCYNGGPNLGTASKPKHGPVPGGARNCPRCRWLATAPVYLPALVDQCNVQLYHLEEARTAALAADREYQNLVAEQIQREREKEESLDQQVIAKARKRADNCLVRFNERVEDVVATMRLVEKCRVVLKQKTKAAASCQELLAVGGLDDVETALREVPSELEQLDLVCEAVEIHPNLEAPTAVLRRSQLMTVALALEGAPLFLFALSKEDQLLVGNAFMERLARAASRENPRAGRRKVIEIMDARQCLSEHLHLDVKSLAEGMQERCIVRLPLAPKK